MLVSAESKFFSADAELSDWDDENPVSAREVASSRNPNDGFLWLIAHHEHTLSYGGTRLCAGGACNLAIICDLVVAGELAIFD